MKLLKQSVLPLVLLTSFFAFNSCEPKAEKKRVTDFQKSAIIMSGAQENPAVPSSAIGLMDVFYSKGSRTLSYTVKWSGLTGPVTAMHIHGLAPTGFNTGVVQNIVTATNGIFTVFTNPPTNTIYRFGATGTLSGTFQVDGFVVKEDDLLNGMYYLNIHTSTYPGGEIRGQIRFQ